jgi:serine/threonine protein kinase/Tfp pilus assembly protein PilF
MTDSSHDNEPTLDSRGLAGVPSTSRALPAEIGGYRIIGLLGEGGMGVVYEAEQPSPRRRVAIKVVRGAELVDEMRLRMFEREAATLARLDHPNIGRIYESGRTEDGRHFFAMELVRGPSLADWLAARPSPPDRTEIELRLRLFRQICDAVHYAHQRGVIHRDLKPSNVIVTDAPAPGTVSESTPLAMVKILDFGLARMTEEDVKATQVTEIGVIKGTLPYMSPEQARGDAGAIDVRTDVYALGVIVYELLTGERPYSVDSGSLLSALATICDQPPRPLADRWRATVRLDPDLETIVATALEKDPDRRYASAAAFGDDLGRFLTSQPIQARPASTMYQLKKLVERRKALFATIGIALVLLMSAAIGIAFLYVRSEANLARALQAEASAKREAATAERTSDFLIDLFDRANPERTRGETVTAKEVMDEGSRRIAEQLHNEPLVQASLMHTIGKVYLSLGVYDKARELLEHAVALRRERLPAGSIEIAASVHQLARALEEQGKTAEARAGYAEAVTLYEGLGPKGIDGLIDVLGNDGWMLAHVGDFPAANAALDRAMKLAEAKQPPDEKRILNLLNNQSTVQMDVGKPDAALALLDRALVLSRRINGDRDFNTASVLTNIGIAHSMAGRFDLAVKNAVEALDIDKAVYGDAHPSVAKGLGNIGIYLAQQGKKAEARPYFEQAIVAMTRIHGPVHPGVAKAYMNLGFLKLESGDPRAAIVDLQRSVDIYDKAAAGSTPSMAVSLSHLADARGAIGEFGEARTLLQRALAIDEKTQGPESGDVADDLEGLAAMERKLGHAAEADRLEARMRGIREKAAAPPKAG